MKKSPNSKGIPSVWRIHCIPVGDVDIHAAQATCWCHPIESHSGVWTHNAKDCRETTERLTGQRCSDGWRLIVESISPNPDLASPNPDGQSPNPDWLSPEEHTRRHGSWLGRLLLRIFREVEYPPTRNNKTRAVHINLRLRWRDILKILVTRRLEVQARTTEVPYTVQVAAYVPPPLWAHRRYLGHLFPRRYVGPAVRGSIPCGVFASYTIPILHYKGEWDQGW